jgi:hypothetical protein
MQIALDGMVFVKGYYYGCSEFLMDGKETIIYLILRR